MGKFSVTEDDTHIVAHPGTDPEDQPQTEVDLDDVSISPIVGDRLFIGKYVFVFWPRTEFLLNYLHYSIASALHLRRSNPHRITHVLSVCPEFTRTSLPAFISEENWMRIPIRDNEREELLVYFDKTSDFIENALKDGRNRVLVHCVIGVSRSVAVVCAYRTSSAL